MDIKIWGPSLWELIHTTALNYKPEYKNKYILFFHSLSPLIPCQKCRYHYNRYYLKNPIKKYLSSKDKLLTWVNNLHNEINRRNKKKMFTLAESKEKFIDSNNNITFHHTKIKPFFNNCINTMTSRKFKSFQNIIHVLQYVHPCDECKLYLNKNLKKHKLNNVKTIKQWYKNINFNKLH